MAKPFQKFWESLYPNEKRFFIEGLAVIVFLLVAVALELNPVVAIGITVGFLLAVSLYEYKSSLASQEIPLPPDKRSQP